MANSEQLLRALENLLYNAADFTPSDGNIIPEKDLPNIFRRSYTTRSDKGGQGLGLAITRAIIIEHGGRIDVFSKEGKGTTFTICLPILKT